MAYRRSICSRATIFARRFNPSSFTYISHGHDDTKTNNQDSSCRKIYDYSTHTRNYSGPRNVFYQKSMVLGGLGSGFCGYRYMSTSVDKSEYLSDVVGVISDKSVEAIASQVPALSEVAIAVVDSAYPVAWLQYVIDGVHSFTGLNWAASIALTTLLIRGATVPFLIKQLKSTSKLAMMRPRLEEIKDQMEAKANDPAAMQEGKQKMNALFKEHGVTPFTPLKGIFIQAPVFISFFLAISNMAEKVPSFKDGGALWFTDLTTPDAMYIFPVLSALTFWINVECNMQEGLEGNSSAKTMKNVSRGLAVLTVPFTMSFAKAIFCYWITSNVFSFAYGSVLRIPGVKEALGIPKMPVAPPPSNKKTSMQSGFQLFKALKEAAASGSSRAIPAASESSRAIPAASGQSKPASVQPKRAIPAASPSSSPSAVLQQRVKSLEKKVKQRKKNKRR